ncbi:helix-turn-helix domain-containing protein [Paenibacillus oryzisoli]|uniref:helix-turn-helix domain-containing protein n=1 Tax=Paenibacillus oryzisoli TaxID=1850517 RepID=UPI003D298D6C
MRLAKRNITKAAGLIYVVIFFVIISATVWLSYINTTKSLRQELIYSNTALLHQVMQKMEMILREVDKGALNLLQESETRMFMDGNYNSELDRLMRFDNLIHNLENMVNSNTLIHSAYLYSYGQKKYVSAYTATDEESFFDKSWKEQFDQFEGYYKWLGVRTLEDKSTQFPVQKKVLTLVRSYPSVTSPSFRKGALIVNIDEAMIYDSSLNEDVRRLGQAFIIDESGQVISHSDKSLLGQHIADRSEIARIMQSGGEGNFTKTIDGVPNLVFYASLGYTGWKYVSIIPSLQLNRELLTVRNWLLLIALFMFVAAIAAVFWVNAVTYRPFERFVRSINRQLNSRNGKERRDEELGNLETAKGLFDSFLEEHDSMQRQVRQSIPAMKWRLISDMLMGYRNTYRDVKPSLEWLGIRLYPAHYIVMSAEFDQKTRISAKDLPLYAYALSNVAEELINAESQGTAVEVVDGRVVIIISFEEEDPHSNILRALSVADLIKAFVEEQFNQTVTIGVGRQYKELEELHKSYREANEAMQYRILLGANNVISVEDIEDFSSQHVYRLFDLTEAVLDAVKAADVVEVGRLLEMLFQQAMQESVPPKLLKQICMQMVLRSLKIGSDIGLSTGVLNEGGVELYEKVDCAENAVDIKRDITGFFDNLLARITEKRNNRGSNEMVDNILKYIAKHYVHSDLSLNLIADTFQLSVPYLSKIFKDYTERNFTDYLIQLRITKAKQLLEDGNDKVAEIAVKIGYSNSHSFIRIFKKVTGMTPGEYREHIILKRSMQK